jgi:gliding motility-associated-like protein
MNPVFASTENNTVCTGATYTYPDGTVSTNILANESHVSNLTSVSGCDSVITTNITISSAFTTTENFNICSGTNYTYPDGTTNTNITVNESHVSTFVSVLGCDSLVTTNLTVDPVYNLTENITACENSSVTYPDGIVEVITASTVHTSSLTTTSGCDSIIVTNVTIAPIFNLVENITTCENSSVTYPDGIVEVITSNTSHTSNLTSTAGCDSIIVSNVTMDPNYNATVDVSICEGEDYTYPDGTVHLAIMANESYISNFVSVSGCDSIIVTNVSVSPSPMINAGTDQTVCDGSSVTLNASGAAIYVWDNGVDDGVSFNPTTTTVYTVVGTDVNGCIGTDAVTVTVSPVPNVIFSADTLTGCEPLAVTFTNQTSISGIDCLWDFGNGNTAVGCGSASTVYNTAGIFTVSLTVTSADGCSATATYADYISVFVQPIAGFSIDQQTVNPDDMEVEFTNTSLNASNYEWLWGDGSANSYDEHPIHEFNASTSNGYTITLIADNGGVCADTTDKFIPLEDLLLFYVPNVFTPNSDQFNNTFYPVFTSGYDPYDYHLMIFNRWGELIFESYNAGIGWDGTYGNGDLVQDDVYVWKIDFKESMSDKRHKHMGHVSVLK